MPGLIVVNGHGGDKYSWYAFYAGILYARAGTVVVTYDPIGEGERNAGRKKQKNPPTKHKNSHAECAEFAERDFSRKCAMLTRCGDFRLQNAGCGLRGRSSTGGTPADKTETVALPKLR